jgi:hypothetical protein
VVVSWDWGAESLPTFPRKKTTKVELIINVKTAKAINLVVHSRHFSSAPPR